MKKMTLPPQLDISKVVHKQRYWTTNWHQSDFEPTESGFLAAVELNHNFNFSLWHEEDIARVDSHGAERIRLAKRNIDKYNQQRNDAMETMDDHLFSFIAPQMRIEETPMHTETPGMIVDRLSIICLKHYHMEEETTRSSASESHRGACAKKLAVLGQQLFDLNDALQKLMADVLAGKRHFRKYRQMKMYNDPQLNPQLYTGLTTLPAAN